MCLERSESERRADTPLPEIEVPKFEIQIVVGILVAQRAVVANIAANPDMIGEEAHDAATEVHGEVVRADRIEEGRFIGHGSQQPSSGCYVRAYTASPCAA